VTRALPIDEHLPEIVRSLGSIPRLVLQASPGSGKTTRVPLALLDAPFTRGQSVWVLEPRRLAAKCAADWVARGIGEKPGGRIGYQFRLESALSSRTRLLFLTEGMLLRRLLQAPTLPGVAAVVLDEFHERHLQGDTALAYLLWLQREHRPDLRLVVMSATLDATRLCAHLEACPGFTVDAKPFPVEIRYLPDDAAARRPLEQKVLAAVRASEGDTLVFLPGMADILRCARALEPHARGPGWEVLPLHGDLSREEQERALVPGRARRIVLATNVAETSLTIEGITTVIDGGLHRQASYSWWSGVPRLRTRPTCRASAIQRTGRAGRTAPGICHRLYTRADFETRAPFDTPEIQRADLSQPYLELAALGVSPAELPWLERPADSALEAARSLLVRLGALTPTGLGEMGRRLAAFPAHPRIARLLLESAALGVQARAAVLAARLVEGDLDRADAIEDTGEDGLPFGVDRTRRQLLRVLGDPGPSALPPDWRARLARSVLAGFPDRIARRRSVPTGARAEPAELVLASGGSAWIEDTALVRENEFLVALDVQESQGIDQKRSRRRVLSACGIEPEWLFDLDPPAVAETEELSWDAERARVVVSSRMEAGGLVLAASEKLPSPSPAVSRVLLREALGILPGVALSLSEWTERLRPVAPPEGLESAIARLQLLARHMPELGASDPSADAIAQAVQDLGSECTSTADLRGRDWPSELILRLGGRAAGRIDELTPLSLTLRGGKRAPVEYAMNRPPWIESRLQDFFGMRQGPTILGGRVALQIHLLAPNRRPVQVTTDLAGFWERAYPALRRELSRRYPRHQWPEDPLAAKPA